MLYHGVLRFCCYRWSNLKSNWRPSYVRRTPISKLPVKGLISTKRFHARSCTSFSLVCMATISFLLVSTSMSASFEIQRWLPASQVPESQRTLYPTKGWLQYGHACGTVSHPLMPPHVWYKSLKTMQDTFMTCTSANTTASISQEIVFGFCCWLFPLFCGTWLRLRWVYMAGIHAIYHAI